MQNAFSQDLQVVGASVFGEVSGGVSGVGEVSGEVSGFCLAQDLQMVGEAEERGMFFSILSP